MGIVAIVAIVTTAAIAQVWTRLQAIELGYKISQATKTQHRLMEDQQTLRMELAQLKNPERIQKIAIETLGLRPPEPEQIRRLNRQSNPEEPPLAASMIPVTHSTP